MVLAVYKETWKWYAEFGGQNLKKEKKNPQRRIIKKRRNDYKCKKRTNRVHIIKVK